MAESIYKIISSFFQALSHPTRIEILDLLKNSEQMCVCEIVAKLKKDQSSISRHLNALKRAGIVKFKGEGVRSIYMIKNKDIYEILDLVKSILHKDIKENQKILEMLTLSR